MKIVVISHYFVPEMGAPSARIYEMAKRWVRSGHQVQVITGFPNHPTGVIPEKYRGMKYLREEMDGIVVHRSYIYATPNKGFLKRTIGHLSFLMSSIIYSMKKVGEIDIVISTSPTFFTMFSGRYLSRKKKVPWILEVRDLWPAAIDALGVLKNKALLRLLEKMELHFYAACDGIVVVTRSFKQNLISRGVPADKIEVITNGVDEEVYKPQSKNQSLLEKYGLQDKFIVTYIGAHGISHALDKVVLAAEQLREQTDIQFVFVGEGAEKEKLISMAREKGLNNILFIGAQPKKDMPDYYNMSDVSVVTLKNIPLFRSFIPSKIFELMGCGVPIIAGLEGEAADILKESGAAVIVPPEAADAISRAVMDLKSNEVLRNRMEKNGPEFVKKYYSRAILADKYIRVMQKNLQEHKKFTNCRGEPCSPA